MNVRLRQVREEDWPAILSVANRSVANIRAAGSQEEWLENRKRFDATRGRREHFVAESDEASIVGYGGIEPIGQADDAEFRLFVVTAPQDLAVVGDILFRSALQAAVRAGAKRLRLTEYSGDAALCAFAAERGFAEKERFPIPDGNEVVVLAKQLNQPTLIVVTGRPGSGKTTLAHALAKAVRCLAICRDEIKEGLVNTACRSGEAADDQFAYAAFFDAIELLLKRQVTLVAEAAFQHALWSAKLERMCEFAQLRIVICAVEPQLARSRHIERGEADPDRQRFHRDREYQAASEDRDSPAAEYDPPKLDVPTLVVDTSDGYRPAFEAIVAFVRGDADAGG